MWLSVVNSNPASSFHHAHISASPSIRLSRVTYSNLTCESKRFFRHHPPGIVEKEHKTLDTQAVIGAGQMVWWQWTLHRAIHQVLRNVDANRRFAACAWRCASSHA
jgi:hypothetical protein